MSNTFVVEALEQLKPFQNDKQFIEIVLRNKDQKIKRMVKVFLHELPRNGEKTLTENAVNLLNKNLHISEKSLQILLNVSKAQQFGLLLNGLNLCATCVGFAIMYEKLDNMSAEINQQIAKVEKTVKKVHDVQAGYEFNKVLSDHTDMLDCRKKQQPYSEEKMRELVDREFNVLMLLIDAFRMDISEDQKNTIIAISSLLSMLTKSVEFFDEVYYQNNHEVLGDGEVWHAAHDRWMGVYNTLTEDWFIEKLQDYGMFEADLDTSAVDFFYNGFLDLVRAARQEVEDNQALLLKLKDPELVHAVIEATDLEAAETVKTAFENVVSELDLEPVQIVFEDALEVVSIA